MSRAAGIFLDSWEVGLFQPHSSRRISSISAGYYYECTRSGDGVNGSFPVTFIPSTQRNRLDLVFQHHPSPRSAAAISFRSAVADAHRYIPAHCSAVLVPSGAELISGTVNETCCQFSASCLSYMGLDGFGTRGFYTHSTSKTWVACLLPKNFVQKRQSSTPNPREVYQKTPRKGRGCDGVVVEPN